MTKYRMAALVALTLAAATLVSPALASAEPEQDPPDSLTAIDFDAAWDNNFLGFRQIAFTCSDYNKGECPYIVKDDPSRSNITYFTGDGTFIGHYFGDFGAIGMGEVGGPLTRIVSREHKTVTFYCANTKQAANQ